jgi:recombination protein RecA
LPKFRAEDAPSYLTTLKAEIEKELGDVLNWGDDQEYVPEKLPLGIPQFDAALDGGFSFKRMTLLVGEEGAGKTLVAMAAMKAAQAREIPTVFIDVERSWTSEWARTVGIDPEKVLVSGPPNGEKAFDVARAIVKHEPAGVIVIDSIAAMPPAKELEDETEKAQIGTQARMVNKALRDLNAENTGGWLIILVNQLREKVGVVYGSPETIPGGVGQKFYAWQLVRVRKGAPIEEGTGDAKVLIGRHVRIRVDKNKQGTPGKSADVPFYFDGQFDIVSGVIDMAIELGVIQSSGGYYAFGGDKWHGRRALREAFDDDETLTLLKEAVGRVESVDEDEL